MATEEYKPQEPVYTALQFNGQNCIQILHWTGCPHYANPELDGTDNPTVYVDGEPVSMMKGDWVIKRGRSHEDLVVVRAVLPGARRN